MTLVCEPTYVYKCYCGANSHTMIQSTFTLTYLDLFSLQLYPSIPITQYLRITLVYSQLIYWSFQHFSLV